MAVETTVLSGSHLANWEEFKSIFTSELDQNNDGRIGDDGSGRRVSRVDRRLDRLDRFFSNEGLDELTLTGGVPTREQFIEAVDPDGDGKVGAGESLRRAVSVDRALRIYDRAIRDFDNHTSPAPESVSLGVEPSPLPAPDPIVFGGEDPMARFTDLVGTQPEVITSELPDTLEVGGLTSDLGTFESDEGLEGFKFKKDQK